LSHSLPQKLLQSLQSVEGFNQDAFEEVHASANRVTSVRINPAKHAGVPSWLPVEAAVPWCTHGYYLSERPSFTLDPLFHAGAYYVQDASSMFVDHVVRHVCNEAMPQHVLDLCGAPGGKSTLLASALPQSFIVSNEVIKARVSGLEENIAKWGSQNVVVTNNDPKQFARLQSFFDLMVVDAPCSGSGLFRKDAEAISEWSEANVLLCSQRQQRILADTIPCLRQNGVLIYSTCSYSREENEDVCDWIIDHFGLETMAVPIEDTWGIVPTHSSKHRAAGYRFYPDKVKGEGFFIAAFRQTSVTDEHSLYASKPIVANKKEAEVITPWLRDPAAYQLLQGNEFIIASPVQWSDSLSIVQKALSVRKSGVAVGSIKGKDLVPHHELALSCLLHEDVHALVVDSNDALQYLRRHDLHTNDAFKGWAVVKYHEVNLGWVKLLPNRINNYYPTNWRILKT